MPRGRTHLFTRLLAVLLLACTTLVLSAGDWPTYLHDNSRSGVASSDETGISTTNAAQLGVVWSYKTGSGTTVASSPTVVNGVVYFGSWNGYEYAVDANTGALKWKTFLGTTNSNASSCVPSTGIGITSAATVQDGVVYVGGNDPSATPSTPTYQSYWYALDAATGNILWKVGTGDNTQKGGHYNWSSPLIYNGDAYIGVASMCDKPLVQGQLVQVDLSTHQIVHTFNFVPSGQVGGGIWTSPSVDAATNTLYVTTGTNGRTPSSQPLSLALVALDASTLALKGSWQVPPAEQTTDSDWGTTPILFSDENGTPLVAGLNKGGYLYAFNRASIGAGPVWQRLIARGGPSPTNGDGSVSSATFAGGSLYMAGGATTVGGAAVAGSVRALDPATGAIRWEQGTGTAVFAALASANGLVVDGAGATLEVRDAASGTVLYSHTTPGWIYGAPSIAEGHIYVGSIDGTLSAFAVTTSTIPTPTPTSASTATPVPPTATPVPPTATAISLSATPTDTAVPSIAPPTATGTSVPPPATATWTSVPQPPTATTVPPPAPTPTWTAVPAPPPPTQAPAPPPATRVSVPPPSTQVPAPLPATATPTSVPPPSGKPGTHHSSPHHPSLPLTLSVDPLHVRSGAMLTLRAHTKPHGSLAITLKVTRVETTWTGQGRHRKQQKHTRVLYKLTARGQAGVKGLSVVRLHVAYRTTRPIAAALMVTAQAAKVRSTRTVHLTILPPQPHPRTHGAAPRG